MEQCHRLFGSIFFTKKDINSANSCKKNKKPKGGVICQWNITTHVFFVNGMVEPMYNVAQVKRAARSMIS